MYACAGPESRWLNQCRPHAMHWHGAGCTKTGCASTLCSQLAMPADRAKRYEEVAKKQVSCLFWDRKFSRMRANIATVAVLTFLNSAAAKRPLRMASSGCVSRPTFPRRSAVRPPKPDLQPYVSPIYRFISRCVDRPRGRAMPCNVLAKTLPRRINDQLWASTSESCRRAFSLAQPDNFLGTRRSG